MFSSQLLSDTGDKSVNLKNKETDLVVSLFTKQTCIIFVGRLYSLIDIFFREHANDHADAVRITKCAFPYSENYSPDSIFYDLSKLLALSNRYSGSSDFSNCG